MREESGFSTHGLTSLSRAAKRILNDGLYALLLESMKAEIGNTDLDIHKVTGVLKGYPGYLDEYRRLNRQSGVSNIDVVELKVHPEQEKTRDRIAKEINFKISLLKELEKYSSSANSLVYGLWVGSAAVLIIFAAHNLFAMLTSGYQDYPIFIYALYALFLIGSVAVHALMMKNHNRRHRGFDKLYKETEMLLEKTLDNGHFEPGELFEG